MRLATFAAAAALLAAAVPGLVVVAPAPAVAQEVQAAPASALIAEVDIPYEKFELDNGLTVLVHEDRKAPVVAVSIWYNVGSKDEPQGRTGFAHLFEHLMFGGSENAPGSYFTPMRSIGATDMNGTTWFDRTNYFETVPTPALERTLYLESDRMGYMLGAITQETLDLQRGVVQNEKRQGDNQPYGLVEYAQLEALFPEGHPYRHSTIGSMADLDAASMETVRTWFRENYGPNNAVLVLAGDIDVATARALTEKHFGSIPRGPVNEPAAADVPTLPEAVSATLHDRVSNARLYRSWTVPGMLDADSVPLSVAASVLGGLASSRLDNALVRGDQSAVSVRSSNGAFHRVGMFDIEVDVKPGQDPVEVGRKLDALIADFIAEGPTEEEIERAVTRYASGRIQGLEQVGGFGGKAVALAEGELYADDPEFYKKQLAAWAAVTPASVKAAMDKWLTRPVWSMTVLPGEREAYAEAAANPSGAAREPAAEIQRVARPAAPDVGQVSDLDFPDVERATLSNGVQVVYAHSDTVPVTRMAVDFNAGLTADRPERLGAHSLMLELLDEGSGEMDSTEFAEAQERLGASINASASMDRSVVQMTALTPNLRPSLDLMAQVLEAPTFAPEEVERLKAQRLARIAQEKTQPAALAVRAMPVRLYGEAHPYGRPFTGSGDQATVQPLTRDDMVAEHAAWLRPDNAKIFVVSDVPLAELTPMLEAALADWRAPSGAKGTKSFDAAIPDVTPAILLLDRPQSPQSYILGGAVLPLSGTDDTLVLNASNNVLGADFLSRINSDLRETKGWSYGVSGAMNPLEHRSPYLVTAPVQADKTGESVAALLDQYRAFLSDRGVTAEERERTVNGNTRRLAGSYETSAAVLGALRSNDLYQRPDDYQETIASRTRAMTAADMDAAARAAIDPAKFTWVIVGDASVVQPQLEALGLPVEVRPANQ